MGIHKQIILYEMRKEISERSAKIEEIFSHFSTDIPVLTQEMKQLKKELTERLALEKL